jgi:ATP-binding cassette subfamily B protein
LALVWAAARYWTLAWTALLVLQGLLPAATVYLTRALVNSLVATASSGSSQNISHTLLLVAFIAGVILLTELLRSAAHWIRTAQSELVQDHIRILVHAKSMAVDLAFYDFPEYYDHLHRARDDASYRPTALLESIGSMVQNGITLVAMAAVLIPYGVWLPIALLVSTLPAFYVVLRYALLQHQWRVRTTADERRSWYYDWLLTAREHAAELRLFGLGEHFQSIYRTLRTRLRDQRLKLAKDQTLAELGAAFFALAITGAAIGWMLWRVLHKQATLGDLALFYQAFNQGQRLMRSLLEDIGQFYSNSLFLSSLFEFLALEPKMTDPLRPVPPPSMLRDSIRFRDVAFRYPGSQRFALQNLSLTIPAGHLVAIVGPNGAGKTTLTKLLSRLYDPERGQIELDMIDLRHLKTDELRRLMTVLPQEYAQYNNTVAENIAFGDISRTPDSARIKSAAREAQADAFIRRLPDGYDALLGKWFEGGTEVSVGERQRIALARALVRPAPIIILDEPTSAMDPWTEMQWLATFRKLVAGRTAIIITQRITTAMCADTIYVLDDGRIVESGNHHQLMAAGGRYAQLLNSQLDVTESLCGFT